jgi:hypothetical protein
MRDCGEPAWRRVLAIALLVSSTFGCKFDPDCWKSKEERPMRCEENWCGNACTDEHAFVWIASYDKCMSEWTDQEVRDNPLLNKHEFTAREHCYSWFLRAHPGITDAQMQRYRLLNGSPKKE